MTLGGYSIGSNMGHSYRSQVSLGKTKLTRIQVWEVLRKLEDQWIGGRYDWRSRNCVHFVEAFCRELGVWTNLPKWVKPWICT